jgi:hypothetical protein
MNSKTSSVDEEPRTQVPETKCETSTENSTSTTDSVGWQQCPNCIMQRCFKFNYCEQVRVQWEAYASRQRLAAS